MANTLVLFERNYHIHIDNDFRGKFCSIDSSILPVGRYVYSVRAEEITTNPSKYVWKSKIFKSTNELVVDKEYVFEYSSLVQRLSFIAELVDFALSYYYEFNDMFVHDYDYFHMPHGMYNDINITNFEIGDSFHNANFNIVVRFDNEWFEWCRRTFENMGIDTQRHKFAQLYHWDISKTSAKLFYGKECLYDYPKPYLLLAYLGWHIAGKAK